MASRKRAKAGRPAAGEHERERLRIRKQLARGRKIERQIVTLANSLQRAIGQSDRALANLATECTLRGKALAAGTMRQRSKPADRSGDSKQGTAVAVDGDVTIERAGSTSH